jgi:pyridoxamine 5'-phosphate oxidase
MNNMPRTQENTGSISQAMRIDYGRAALNESDALADPIDQFSRWFAEAEAAGIAEANAMTLATADRQGVPSARVVLLKGFGKNGFTFYTNYASRKGADLASNPHAALCFYWQTLERQVRIEGRVETVSRAESEAYFRSRPVAAQIGAWTSHQSEVIPSRATIEQREAELVARFGAGVVPLPDFWGGYRVVPRAIEFWQGRASRLHDRLLYIREGGNWALQRLSP